MHITRIFSTLSKVAFALGVLLALSQVWILTKAGNYSFVIGYAIFLGLLGTVIFTGLKISTQDKT